MFYILDFVIRSIHPTNVSFIKEVSYSMTLQWPTFFILFLDFRKYNDNICLEINVFIFKKDDDVILMISVKVEFLEL